MSEQLSLFDSMSIRTGDTVRRKMRSEKENLNMSLEQIEAIEFQLKYFESLGDSNPEETVLRAHKQEGEWGNLLDTISFDALSNYIKARSI